jgi:hypothetical protein
VSSRRQASSLAVLSPDRSRVDGRPDAGELEETESTALSCFFRPNGHTILNEYLETNLLNKMGAWVLVMGRPKIM